MYHPYPGDHTQLVTLGAGCHARVHRTRILGRWLPEILVDLWREWHPDDIEQIRLPIEMSAGVVGQAAPKKEICTLAPADGGYTNQCLGHGPAAAMRWNNAPLEGHVNRLKMIKRQMYGRAGFHLLKARVLPWKSSA